MNNRYEASNYSLKKRYETPEWEVVSFNADELRTVSSTCPQDCSHCFYLVCEPQDVIIGG